MKNQTLPNSHFCLKISKVPNSPPRNTGSPLHSLIANHVFEMSVKLRFQCEKKHCFALVVLKLFPICFY